MAKGAILHDAGTLTVSVPMTFKKRGGRKLVIGPDGEECWPRHARIDSALIKAVARAFRWRKLLESGAHATIEDLAKAEKINASYVSRILRLTLLAPEIIEAILDGRQARDLQLEALLKPMPVEWEGQTAATCAQRM